MNLERDQEGRSFVLDALEWANVVVRLRRDVARLQKECGALKSERDELKRNLAAVRKRKRLRV